MNDTTFILHGLGADSNSNWFPWLATALQKGEQNVTVPNFPNSVQPTYGEWRDCLESFAANITDTTIFIGHSLGCPFGLQYLSEKNITIDSFILVAPPYTNLGWPQLEDMMQNFPPKNAKNTAKKFYLFGSDNDPYIPLNHMRKYEELLGIKAHILQDREHIWQAEIPEVLQICKHE